jgi:energy-converting hydrogenase Eha subunit C
VVNTSQIVLLSYPLFKLIHALLLVANLMKFILSTFYLSLLALNHLFGSAKTSLIEF